MVGIVFWIDTYKMTNISETVKFLVGDIFILYKYEKYLGFYTFYWKYWVFIKWTKKKETYQSLYFCAYVYFHSRLLITISKYYAPNYR